MQEERREEAAADGESVPTDTETAAVSSLEDSGDVDKVDDGLGGVSDDADAAAESPVGDATAEPATAGTESPALTDNSKVGDEEDPDGDTAENTTADAADTAVTAAAAAAAKSIFDEGTQFPILQLSALHTCTNTAHTRTPVRTYSHWLRDHCGLRVDDEDEEYVDEDAAYAPDESVPGKERKAKKVKGPRKKTEKQLQKDHIELQKAANKMRRENASEG
jgi:hypothetical protein